MPKRFSEQEREIIRTLLVREGRKLFGVHGLRKTNIGELSKAAGIAQGTFYNFFHSKEELYFHIIEEEQEKSEQQLHRHRKVQRFRQRSSYANYFGFIRPDSSEFGSSEYN